MRKTSFTMRPVAAIVLGLALILCCQFYMLNQAISSGDRRALYAEQQHNEVTMLKARVAELLVGIQTSDDRVRVLQNELASCRWNQKKEETKDAAKRHTNSNATAAPAFPSTMSSFLHGVSRIRKEEFIKTFDYGLPDITDRERQAGQSEVLLLYNTEAAVPSSASDNAGGFAGPLLSVKEATQKCKTLNIVSIGDPKESSDMFVGAQCLALVGHEQMYHVQRFVKSDNDNFGLVQREIIKERKTGNYAGRYMFETENEETSPARLHREFLAKYLPYVDTLKARLKPVLESIAINNTVVVMVCNKDQSSLLHNFACACLAKGIQLDNVVVFPTDKDTSSLAQELGFATFYDEEVRDGAMGIKLAL